MMNRNTLLPPRMICRFVAIVMALLMAVSMTAMAEVHIEGLPIVDEPIVLTGAAYQTSFQNDVTDTVVLQEFAEASGVKIQFQNIPSSDAATQLSLMLASGEVPDVLFKMGVSTADQARYTEQGMFVALSDYAEYCPNLMEWLDKYPTQKLAVTLPDGKIYGAPYILAGDAIRMSTKMWFNTDLMEKVGYEAIPTTLDGLYEYLNTIKDYDYNGNGQADEIPLTAGSIGDIINVLSGSFGLMNRGSAHPNVYVDDEGVLQFAYDSDHYRELLKFVSKLYAEGLLDQDIFSNETNHLITKCSTGRGLTYCYVNNSPVSNSDYEQYTLGFTEPFEGYNGEKQYTMYSLPSSSAGQFLVTYKCVEKGEEYVKAAIRWMDHWYTEEGIIAYFMGIEGVSYEKDENSPGGLKLTDEILNDPEGRPFGEVLAKYCTWTGGRNPSVATNEYFKGGETWPVCLDAVEGLINYIPEEVWGPFGAFYTTEETAEMGQLKTDIDTYHSEWRANIIVGNLDVNDDAVWAEYVAGFDGVGLPRYMELYRKGAESYAAEMAE